MPILIRKKQGLGEADKETKIKERRGGGVRLQEGERPNAFVLPEKGGRKKGREKKREGSKVRKML